MDSYALDDAAAAALYGIRKAPVEHIGALYENGQGVERTEPKSRRMGSKVRATISFPGVLQALFHNHPVLTKRDYYAGRFSPDDKDQARQLQVPTYISVGDQIMKFDPRTGRTEEVLAMFPIGEMLKEFK